jgi:hypothetical protein
MIPSPDVIRETQSNPRPLRIEPWVAANLSRLWQSMKVHLQKTTVPTVPIVSDSQEQPHSDQSAPASARSHS